MYSVPGSSFYPILSKTLSLCVPVHGIPAELSHLVHVWLVMGFCPRLALHLDPCNMVLLIYTYHCSFLLMLYLLPSLKLLKNKQTNKLFCLQAWASDTAMLEIFEIQIQILILNFSAAPSTADTQIHPAL